MAGRDPRSADSRRSRSRRGGAAEHTSAGRTNSARGADGRKGGPSSGPAGGRGRQSGKTGARASSRPVRSRGTRQARLRRGLAAKRASGAARVLGLSTTRRAAVLAIVVCALAFTVAVPLRTYLEQQAELAEQLQRRAELRAKIERLTDRKQELADPAVIERLARSRLGWVMPGETPYMVQLPGAQRRLESRLGQHHRPEPVPWYERVWDTINEGPSTGRTNGDSAE